MSHVSRRDLGLHAYPVDLCLQLLEGRPQARIGVRGPGRDHGQARTQDARGDLEEEQRSAEALVRDAIAVRGRDPFDQAPEPQAPQVIAQPTARQVIRRDAQQRPDLRAEPGVGESLGACPGNGS